jgi:hypothetical protein
MDTPSSIASFVSQIAKDWILLYGHSSLQSTGWTEIARSLDDIVRIN